MILKLILMGLFWGAGPQAPPSIDQYQHPRLLPQERDRDLEKKLEAAFYRR